MAGGNSTIRKSAIYTKFWYIFWYIVWLFLLNKYDYFIINIYFYGFVHNFFMLSPNGIGSNLSIFLLLSSPCAKLFTCLIRSWESFFIGVNWALLTILFDLVGTTGVDVYVWFYLAPRTIWFIRKESFYFYLSILRWEFRKMIYFLSFSPSKSRELCWSLGNITFFYL